MLARNADFKIRPTKADFINGSESVTQNQIPITTKRLYGPAKTKHLFQWYALLDALALMIGHLSALGLAALINNSLLGRAVIDPFSEDQIVHLIQCLMLAIAVLMWFQHTGHYRTCMPFWIETRKILSVLAFAAMADGFLQFASKQYLSRLWLMSGWVIAAFAIIAFRNLVRVYLRKKGHLKMRTLLFGSGVTAQHTREALVSDCCLNYEIIKQIKDLPKEFSKAGRSWETLCSMYSAEYIIIALDGYELATAEGPLEQLVRESVPFSVSPPLGHLPVMGMVPQYFMSHDVMLLARSNGLEQFFPCLLKRMFDIIVSATALLALAPVMLILIIWVKSSGGSAFYAHMRIGRNKKPFPCLKFRSMALNSDAILELYLSKNLVARQEWENSQKLQNDPRITRVGKILRSSSLDELPQLINVLRGDMSLVGPRPIVNAEVAKYDGDFAHYCRVRPGITGLWQVSGRSDISYPRRVHMDSWYVRNWSLWHDIAILCKTFPVLFKRTGAY